MPVLVPNDYQRSLSDIYNDPHILGEAPVNLPDEEPSEGDPSQEDHYANLAETLDVSVIADAAREVMDFVDDDIEAHTKFGTTHAEIYKALGFDRNEDKRNEPMEGSTGVVSPLLARAATDLSARIMAQLRPASGPTRIAIVGVPDDKKEAKAARIKAYMDLQQTQLIRGYSRQEDLLMTHLPLVGTCFKKLFWNGSEIQTEYIRSENLIIPYHTESLDQAERITHRIHMAKAEFERLQRAGFYLDEPLPPPARVEQSPFERTMDRIQGTQPTENDEGLFEFFEVHCLLDLPGEDGPCPYILTYESDSKLIVRLSRDWAEDDDTRTREECFIDYTMMQFRGVYGLGLYHQIGGLAKTATDALRALLDSAKLKNTPMGFRLKSATIGAASGTELRVGPYQYAEVDAAGTSAKSISDVIMNLPFEGPNPTLFDLLKYVEEQAMSFANINAQLIADSNNTGPVGTTFALLEESAKVFNAIFSRIHDSKRRELQLIKKLNYRHLEDSSTVKQFGGEMVVQRADFDEDCDVLPTSDPNVSSNAQRVAQLQAVTQIAQMAPQFINQQKLLQKSFTILGLTDFEDLIAPPPPKPMPRDPIGNVQAILSGQPVDAFPQQDVDAHIAVYLAVLQSPIYGANPLMATSLNPPLMALIGSFLKLRLGKMYGHAVSGNPQVPTPLGLTASPNAASPQMANDLAKQMASEAGYVLAADKILAETMTPIVAAAMKMMPPPPVDPMMVSAQAEKDNVQARHQADIMEIVTHAADIQSRERIAEMQANQATDRALIQAQGQAPQTPTAFTPEGVLPQNVPDPVSQIAAELWGLMQKFSNAGAPPPPSTNGPHPGGPPPGGPPHPGPGPMPPMPPPPHPGGPPPGGPPPMGPAPLGNGSPGSLVKGVP